MKLVDIDVIPIEIPLPKPLLGSTYSVPTRCTIITRLNTDDVSSSTSRTRT
ncbi:MAG: hypothetical protein V3S24_14315 [Candidatus Tectomicrobia bacterium]